MVVTVFQNLNMRVLVYEAKNIYFVCLFVLCLLPMQFITDDCVYLGCHFVTITKNWYEKCGHVFSLSI